MLKPAFSKEEQIQQKVFQIKRLSAMPQVVWKLVEALDDDRTTVKTLGNIIESDVALASKILSLANSAYYSLSQKASTVARAIVVIGFRELELLAVGAGLADVFDLKSTDPELKGEDLWLHCLAVAWLARELAVSARAASPGEVMIAGLLHDLGKLALVTQLKDEAHELARKLAEGVPYHVAEAELEIKHTVIGDLLAKRWALPEVHRSVIRYHHQKPGDLNPYLQTICLVQAADILVKRIGIGLVSEAPAQDFDKILAGARIQSALVDSIVARASKELIIQTETWKNMLTETH